MESHAGRTLWECQCRHKRFLEWEAVGFFEALWRAGLNEYDEMEGISRSDRPPRIGGKNGSKRHLLEDGRGIPLPLVVTGANRHDVTQLETVLEAIQVKRPTPPKRRAQHLCTDAGFRGAPSRKTILAHGYISYVKGRRQEAKELKRHPGKRASLDCRGRPYRKLLVRYEKLELSFVALNHLAATIIAFRKVPLTGNIVYG